MTGNHKSMIASAVLLMTTCAAHAELISDVDRFFVVETLGASFATKSCGAKLIDGGLEKYAERTGVEYVKTYNAINAAFRALVDQPYKSENLIPAITVFVNKWATGLLAAKERDESKTCTAIIENLKANRIVE